MIKKTWALVREQPAFAGLCLVAGAEAAINATFGYQYYGGEHWLAGALMAAVLLGNEMVKWQAADGVGEAVTGNDPLRAWIWAIVLVACVSISLPAHIGFIGMWRNDVAAKREATADIKGSSRQQLARLVDEQERLGTQRPAASVRADVERACQKGRTPKCLALEGELGRAERAAALPQLIGDAERQRQASGGVGVADPQAQVLGWFWSADEERKKMSLAIALAVAMEIMTSLGFIAVGNRRRTGWGTDVLVGEGLLTHPGAAHVIQFRSDRAGVLRNARGEDDVWSVYQKWADDQGMQQLQRNAFFRLLQAMTGKERALG